MKETVVRRILSFEEKSAMVKENSGLTPAPVGDSVAEHHHTARDVAAILSLSDDKVRRMFQDEPGVVVISDQSTRHKRRYTTLRIPDSVLRRVIRRMSNV